MPRRGPAERPPFLLLVLLVALAAGACSALGGGPTPRPDPAQPCGGADEQRAAGFYPDLEALLPTTLDGAAPDPRDSGRYCSAAKLGTLVAAGVAELHFAGAVWRVGSATGVTLVVYRAPGLTADAMADSFTAAAGAARNITQLKTAAETIAGRPGIRIDAANGDTHEVTVLWPAASAGTVYGVLASDVGEARIARAISAIGDR